MNALVSLLIPCYNGEKFLNRCFKCILNQDYSNIEIIFVNDGSTDNSEDLVNSYKEKFKTKGFLFKYIYQNNNGAASAINTALKVVSGEYIMLYDVDDIIFPSAIKEKVEFLELNRDYDMVRNNGYYVNNDNTEEILGVFSDNKLEKENEYIFEDLVFGKTINWPASFMIRSNRLFENIKDKEIYISQFGQNLQIMLPVALNGRSGYIDKPLMKYVRHKNSHSAFTSNKRRLELYNGYEKNRVEVINRLNINLDKKKEYIRKVNLLYYRIRMQIAYEIKDIDLLEDQYKKIKKVKENTKEDDILYKRGKYSIYDNLFKIKSRTYRLLNKIKCIYIREGDINANN